MDNIIKYCKGVEIHVLGLGHFGKPIDYNGATIHPRGQNPYGYDQLAHVINKVRPTKIITLCDIGYQASYYNIIKILKDRGVWNGKWMPYVPIDSLCVVDWMKTILEPADQVITMSHYGAHMLSKFNINCVTIPHGVDTGDFHPLNEKERLKAKKKVGLIDKFVVLSVGKNQVRKMWDRLIKGYALFAADKNDVMFLMHTDDDGIKDKGDKGFNINVLTNKYDCLKKCAFTYEDTKNDPLWRNKFDEEALNQVYNLADCMLMGGAEGFGLPSIECQSAGVPLIAGYQTATMELFPSDFGKVKLCGYIEGSLGVEFGTPCPKSIAAELQRMYDMSKEARADLKVKAREFAKEKYEWKFICEEGWSKILNE